MIRRFLSLIAGTLGRAVVSALALVVIIWVARGRGWELLVAVAAFGELWLTFLAVVFLLFVLAGFAGAIEHVPAKEAEDA